MFYIPPTKIKNMFHRYLESINPFITQKLNFTVKRYAIIPFEVLLSSIVNDCRFGVYWRRKKYKKSMDRIAHLSHVVPAIVQLLRFSQDFFFRSSFPWKVWPHIVALMGHDITKLEFTPHGECLWTISIYTIPGSFHADFILSDQMVL